MAEVTVKVCDLCDEGDRREVIDEFAISHGSHVRLLDVCVAHAVTLRELFRAGRPRRRKPRQSRTGANLKVVTLEEIEASKAQ